MTRLRPYGARVCGAAVVLWCLLAPVGAPAFAAAQSGELERELDEAKTLYREGRFDATVAKLRGVIAQLQQLRDIQSRKVQLADAHLLLGLAHLAMRAESDALENFRQVVTLDPGRTLDPEIFSPRVVALFDRARSEAAAARTAEAPAQPPREREPEPARSKEPAGAPRSDQVPLTAGTMMRLQFSGAGRHVKGNLIALNDQSFILVDGDNQQQLTFPRDMVTRVDILHRRKAHTLQGAMIGAGVGALIGAVETPGCDSSGECWTRGENIAYGALGAGLVGALVGALYRTDEWVEVPVNRLANTAARTGKRVTIGIPVVSWE